MGLIVLYEGMLLVQVQVGSGVKGLFFSLLPSLPLSVIGWYLKRRSRRKTENNADSEILWLRMDEQPSMHTFENQNFRSFSEC